ncbi:hypothetical protein [Trichlorobacter ammonificans]|uniref:hypothetical protein n=1 Tax=Trichlorobacter ammonificans TaxID=2916410 RepID=UPI002737ABA9|nr:hypothetical protein [Trichlorobacter ammonificans]
MTPRSAQCTARLPRPVVKRDDAPDSGSSESRRRHAGQGAPAGTADLFESFSVLNQSTSSAS